MSQTPKQAFFCKKCKQPFTGGKYRKNKDVCNICFLSTNRIERTPEYREKCREGQKNYYKNVPQEEKENRWKNISKSRTKHLSEEEVEKIKEVISRRYVWDKRCIMIQAGIKDKSYKALLTYIKENKEWWEKVEPTIIKFVPKKVQLWKKETFDEFIKDCRENHYTYACNKYELNEKTVCRLVQKIGIIKGKIGKKETQPETFVRRYLEELCIKYEREKYINNMRFRVDFKIDRKVIEVQGDYFHANPLMYDYSKLTTIQLKNIATDALKRKWLSENNYKLLEIWEKEIYETPDLVKLKIKEYVYK